MKSQRHMILLAFVYLVHGSVGEDYMTHSKFETERENVQKQMQQMQEQMQQQMQQLKEQMDVERLEWKNDIKAKDEAIAALTTGYKKSGTHEKHTQVQLTAGGEVMQLVSAADFDHQPLVLVPHHLQPTFLAGHLMHCPFAGFPPDPSLVQAQLHSRARS
jgi:hypothetical protein